MSYGWIPGRQTDMFECYYTVVRKGILRVHIQSVYEGTYTGERCDHEAAQKGYLYVHIRPCPNRLCTHAFLHLNH